MTSFTFPVTTLAPSRNTVTNTIITCSLDDRKRICDYKWRFRDGALITTAFSQEKQCESPVSFETLIYQAPTGIQTYKRNDNPYDFTRDNLHFSRTQNENRWTTVGSNSFIYVRGEIFALVDTSEVERLKHYFFRLHHNSTGYESTVTDLKFVIDGRYKVLSLTKILLGERYRRIIHKNGDMLDHRLTNLIPVL